MTLTRCLVSLVLAVAVLASPPVAAAQTKVVYLLTSATPDVAQAPHSSVPVALGYWKLAIILEGVFSRYSKGQYGRPEDGFEEFGRNVVRLAEAADEAVARLG